AGRAVSGEGDVAGDGDVGFEADDSGAIEDDEAVRFADGVAERARAGVVEVCDVKDFAIACASGECAEAFGGGEGEGRAWFGAKDRETQRDGEAEGAGERLR